MKRTESAARKKIVKTACQLFYKDGIRATGVDKIIAKSGVAKMTFYKHFPSKKGLVLEVLRVGGDDWFEGLQSTVEQRPRGTKERLLAIFDFLRAWFKNSDFKGCAFVNTSSEIRDPQSEESIYSSKQKARLVTYIEALAQDAGIKDARHLSERFLLLIDGAIVRAQMDDNAHFANVAEDIAAMLLDNAWETEKKKR